MSSRERSRVAPYWVIKVGSALLTNNSAGLDAERIRDWTNQIARLRASGRRVVIVSSGAIACGMLKLGWSRRPNALHEQQAAAAVGQSGLAEVWSQAFGDAITTAQVLLTAGDLDDRTRYLNARSTLRTLLALDIVPIVNENDTVAIEEIQFGDNDTLAALVTNLVEAEKLIILTDQDGLYDADPRRESSANLVTDGVAGDERLDKMAGPSVGIGRGGMTTKLRAASLAARSGAETIIAGGRVPDVLLKIADGNNPGTRLRAPQGRLVSRKQWLAGRLRASGILHIDAGAERVLREAGRSLLPVGVVSVEGNFERGDVVSCCGPDGTEVARGLVNYRSDEARKIAGLASDAIADCLGYIDEPELVHRDNLVVSSSIS